MATRRIPLRGLLLAGAVVAVAALLLAAAAFALPGSSVRITTAPGETLAYVPAEVRVSTADAIVLEFRNVSDLEHNLTFTGTLQGSTRTIVGPGESDRLVIHPPGPGSYLFVCTIHEGMAGRLIVEGGSGG